MIISILQHKLDIRDRGCWGAMLFTGSKFQGYFTELRNGTAQTEVHHELLVEIRGTKLKHAVKFLWDGSPRSLPQIREILATFGLRETSVFLLSEEKVCWRIPTSSGKARENIPVDECLLYASSEPTLLRSRKETWTRSSSSEAGSTICPS